MHLMQQVINQRCDQTSTIITLNLVKQMITHACNTAMTKMVNQVDFTMQKVIFNTKNCFNTLKQAITTC